MSAKLAKKNWALAWSKAYGRQASSDWRTYGLLVRHRADLCQQLRYLQMACEKLSKAYLVAAGADPETMQSEHRAAGKQLPFIVRQFLSAPEFATLSERAKQLVNKRARTFARGKRLAMFCGL